MNFKQDMLIADKQVGIGHKPFIIAEMSGNHNQSLERALAIVDAAAAAGADAIKLQTYTADTISMKGALTINDPNSLWNGKELYDLYKEAYTPWEWHETIFNRAKEKGMLAFSSPFDVTAVDFLESLNVPAYKIASFENTDWTLLKKVAETKKPIIISTGASNISDIDESLRLLRSLGCENVIVLKCTSTYPASPENTNLRTIPVMEKMFRCPIGLSDHTMGIGVSLTAIAFGACVIEKHFTLSRAEGGVDSAFSMEPAELKSLVDESERAFLALGEVQLSVQDNEQKSLIFKRSLYVVSDISKGDTFTEDHIRSFRPAIGIETKFIDKIIGSVAKSDIKKGTPITWDLI